MIHGVRGGGVMAKRAHLQRDLGWGAAMVVLLAVTTVRAGVADRFGTDSFDADLFERHVPHRRRPDRRRSLRRRLAQGRSAAVLGTDPQQSTGSHPAGAVTVRCGPPLCARHGRRSLDTGEWSDGRVETERRRPQPLAPVPSGGWGRSLASVSASMSSFTPSSTSASTFASWSSSTSSNRSPRNRGAQR
jgi:hypothetical protein